MIRIQKSFIRFKEYLPLLLLMTAILLYFSNNLNMPLVDDEIAAYGIPALKLNYDNFASALPWNYTPGDFFGHPPLNSIYFGLVLRLFPSNLEPLRFASLLITFLSLLAFYQIGKQLRSKALGYTMVFMWVSHFIFWENANLIFADNLFNLLFLLLIYSYFKDSRTGMMIYGLAMVLTRETALVPFVALWLMEFFRQKNNQKSHLAIFSPLVLAQIFWFLFLWIKSGSPTPVYHNDGFFFEPRFILMTFWSIVWTNLIKSYWFLTFFLVLVLPSRDILKKYWYLILISLTLIVGLSTITASISRYQMIGLSSWIITLSILIFSQAKLISRHMKFLLGILGGILFLRNFYLGHHTQVWGKNFQEKSYSCAKQIKNMNLEGKVLIGGWPLFEIINSYSSLQTLSWPPLKDKANYLYFDSQYSRVMDYDYFGIFNLGQNRENRNFFNQLKSDPRHLLISSANKNSACSVYRKSK